MRILIVEDKPVEQAKAKAAVEAAGHEAVVIESYSVRDSMRAMPGVDGILTDLHFPPLGRADYEGMMYQDRNKYLQNPPPSGINVVILAMHLGIPVVVCTDGCGEGHHGPTLGWFYDGLVALSYELYQTTKGEETFRGQARLDFPFGWEEDKDWERALGDLLDRINAKKESP